MCMYACTNTYELYFVKGEDIEILHEFEIYCFEDTLSVKRSDLKEIVAVLLRYMHFLMNQMCLVLKSRSVFMTARV